MNLIKKSSVAIFNCETLGSNIAVTLARSGIKKLILIDNNVLSIDNYKYHPFAILSDIYENNLDILQDYISQINPNIELILIKEDINYDNLSIHFKNNTPDYIVECLNETKIIEKCKLIKYVKDNPSLTNLIIENYKRLYDSGVPNFNIIYSQQEKTEENLANISENLFSYGVISDTASSIILCDLAKFQVQADKDKKEKEEIKVGGKDLSEAIIEYKKDEIEKKKTEEKYLSMLTYNDFRLICSGFKNGSCLKQKPTSKMRFIRWRLYKEPSLNNIVIMGKSEINSHLKIHNEEELIKFYTKPVVDRIDGILNSLKDK